MRQDLLIAVILIALVVIGGGIFIATGGFPGSGSAVSVVSFQTDKDVYHSKELMKLQVGLSSGTAMENVTVHIEGISDRYGDIRLKKDISLNLVPGTNTVTYEYQLPTCSSCSGLDPGIYPINVTVIRLGKAIAIGNHTVHLEQ